MRLLPADLAGLRRTVNAVAWRIESDPHQTNRIVRPWRDDQLAPGFYSFEVELRWIVDIGRVSGNADHLVTSFRRRGLAAADSRRISGNQAVCGVEHPNRLRPFVDLNAFDGGQG